MKRRGDENLILFGPMGFWRCFAFYMRLSRARIECRICKNPRSIAVRGADLEQASRIYEEIGGNLGK